MLGQKRKAADSPGYEPGTCDLSVFAGHLKRIDTEELDPARVNVLHADPRTT
jgi:hypothetical protein